MDAHFLRRKGFLSPRSGLQHHLRPMQRSAQDGNKELWKPLTALDHQPLWSIGIPGKCTSCLSKDPDLEKCSSAHLHQKHLLQEVHGRVWTSPRAEPEGKWAGLMQGQKQVLLCQMPSWRFEWADKKHAGRALWREDSEDIPKALKRPTFSLQVPGKEWV